MSVSDPVWPSSPLSAAATAFATLTCDPNPLSLDLGPLVAAFPDAGLPCGVLPLPQLSTWLQEHRDAYDARDIVWRELIRRARDLGREWLIAAVGMAMPALVRYAAELAAMYRGDRDDIDAEILTGFLAALRRIDLDRAAPHAALCMAVASAAASPSHRSDTRRATASRPGSRPRGVRPTNQPAHRSRPDEPQRGSAAGTEPGHLHRATPARKRPCPADVCRARSAHTRPCPANVCQARPRTSTADPYTGQRTRPV